VGIRLKDATISIPGEKKTDIENEDDYRKHSKELTVPIENFIASMRQMIGSSIDWDYLDNMTYQKTYGYVNEFIDEKLQGFFSHIQKNFGIKKPFKVLMWLLLERVKDLKEQDRDYYIITAIGCRMTDTFYYIKQQEEEAKIVDGHRIAETELKCRGYFGEKIKQEFKQLYMDVEF
jgi:hypothetical protein